MSDHEIACLFIDDSHIEHIEGLEKGVLAAEKVSAEPLLQNDQPWEAGWSISYVNVIHDEQDGLFKMWYRTTDQYKAQRGPMPSPRME